MHHIKSKHTRDFNLNELLDLTCNVCNKQLSDKGNLAVHMRVHTGVKPYSCKFCATMFRSIGNKKDHERRHTGDK